MKNLVKPLLVIAFVWCLANGAVVAQPSAKEAAKETALKNKINNKRFTFIAEYAQPMGGGQRYLTSEYDLKVRPDSIIAELPYFGRVYMDTPIYPDDAGINFTSTKFDYTVTDKKKKGYIIVINIKDNRRTSRFTFDTSANGYTTLTMTSNTSDPISFLGHIEEEKEKK